MRSDLSPETGDTTASERVLARWGNPLPRMGGADDGAADGGNGSSDAGKDGAASGDGKQGADTAAGKDGAAAGTKDTGKDPDLSADEQKLPDAIKDALRKERTDRRAAEKLAAQHAAKIKEFEDRDKTESQKLEERVTNAEKDAADWKTRYFQLKVAADKGLPADLADLLQGDDEKEMGKHADTLLKHVKPGASPGSFDQGQRGGSPASGTSMNDLIRQRAGIST